MDIEKIDVEIPEKQQKIPTYWAFAIVSCFVNPPLGLLALIFAWECRRCQLNNWPHARRYSDLTFSLCVLSFVTTILILVFVYAIGDFPRSRYYCRQDVIEGRDPIRKECPTSSEEE